MVDDENRGLLVIEHHRSDFYQSPSAVSDCNKRLLNVLMLWLDLQLITTYSYACGNIGTAPIAKVLTLVAAHRWLWLDLEQA